MNPHPRIRTTIKWGGLAGAVVCIALMGVSRWRTLHVGWVGHGGLTVYRGRVLLDNEILNQFSTSNRAPAAQTPWMPSFATYIIVSDPPAAAPSTPDNTGAPVAAEYIHQGSLSMTDIFDYLAAYGSFRSAALFPGIISWQVVFPLYVPLILLAGASAAAWAAQSRAARRARLGLCPKCRYDRAGLPAGVVCPECGASAPAGPDRCMR